jgi:formylglycine-generating enzyme required for sulfatase activity
MKSVVTITLSSFFLGWLSLPSSALAAKCPKDSVQVGPVCIDTHEASVWEIPSGNKALIKKVQKGTATLADLTGGGATQRGLGTTDDYPCSDNGNDCDDIYAVSIAGVKPSANITWLQAQQVCMNAGKRLPRNGEWQGAAAGTPDLGTDDDSTDCNITDDGFPANDPVHTGSRSNCASRWGAHDMVGNLWEWVEDWGAPATTCTPELFSGTGDLNCLAGASTTSGPAALIRGGSFLGGASAGVFAVYGLGQPSRTFLDVGVRCAR